MGKNFAGQTVVNLASVRQEKIEEKRREYERVVFKSNFGIYKDLNLKSKFGSQTIEYPFVEKQGFTQKHIDFGKVISGPLERKNKKMLI